MFNYFLIGLGAAIGGIFRYWLSGFVQKLLTINFPYGTLLVNVIGSFILGIIIFYFDAKSLISNEVKLFLTIGFCGGFTTFSTFSLETINLIKNSEFLNALIYITSSVVLSLLAVLLAYYFSKIIN